MPSHTALARRITLSALVFSCLVSSACGVRFETIAAPPPLPAAPVAAFGPAEAAGLIFTPCIPGAGRPHAFSGISDRLLGKDPFAVDCEHRTNGPARPAPPVDRAVSADLVVTDELINAVLTGTGEYWYQPGIGPA